MQIAVCGDNELHLLEIQRFQSDEIMLKNGKTIPVSRSKYNETKKAFNMF